MQTDGHLLVIGASGIDLKGSPHGPLEAGVSNPGLVRQSFGGVGRNVAENLARLELDVTLLTVVGIDLAAENLVAHCQENGINMDYVKYCDGWRTGSYISILNADGDLSTAISDYEIMTQLDVPYLETQKSLLQHAEMVMFDTNLPLESIEWIIEHAQKAGVPVVVDPTSTAKARKLREHFHKLYMIAPNASEAAAICGIEVSADNHQSAVQAAQYLVEHGVEIAVVTIGSLGLAYADGSSKGHIPALQTRIVDSTGAGDALTAGVIFGLVNEVSLDDAMRLGITAATLTLKSADTVSALLTPDLLYETLVV